MRHMIMVLTEEIPTAVCMYICAADSYILKIKLFAVVNTFAYCGGGAAVQGVRLFPIKKCLNER
jgi:hypothetical protein